MRSAAALAGGAAAVFLAYRYVVSSPDAGALVETSVRGRLSIYGDAWRWWRDTPLFGTGLGSFETIYPAYQDFELRAAVSHAHSDWLEIALEAGTFGLLAALAAAALAALAAVRAWRAARSDEMRALIGGGIAAAAAFSAHALFEFCFSIPGNAVVFLGLVGFLLSAPAWADKASDRAPSRPPDAWRAALAAACFLFLTQAAVRPAAAAWLASASDLPGERAARLVRAEALDPNPVYLEELAAIGYQESGVGDGTNLAALRAALAYSLAAAQLRPFDSDALFLSGASLWRLGRRTDGGALMSASRAMRFPALGPVAPDPLAEFERQQRVTRRLRSAGAGAPPPPETR
jgi:hypothetical protein